MLKFDIDHMIMVMLKKMLKTFRSITNMMKRGFYAKHKTRGFTNEEWQYAGVGNEESSNQHAGNAKWYVTLFLDIRSSAYIVRVMKRK